MKLTVEQLMNALVKSLTEGNITAHTTIAVESNFDHKVTDSAGTVSLETDLFTGAKRVVIRS
jgi:hypothetical protein